ncbi:UDP-glucose 4-epimerase GalE [Rhodoferax sp. 4810]|uniref:UDP-glucose 4-epimerase n=1 Tax=Thiospirillum jenense TaxID=1653858 RepID=A0A839HJ84_9GAMM|nr:UDP-glucose 4-epimerase GalE [Rhodoferax jenense]MBB1126857.1 UDP-glucose 4-epimerase GalE [Thiospirillum jenense]
MNILLTGGAGYIGSHILVELLNAGHYVVVVDNFCNSKIDALHRVQEITGQSFITKKLDLRDATAVEQVFKEHYYDAVIHCAGLKAVGESTQIPLTYYDNNLIGTIYLCKAMAQAGVKTLVFSSSATVYGYPATVPIDEDFPLAATNPYGRTKLFIEELLRDLAVADSSWRISLLRYFNPIGAHPSGRIGENPNGIPNNLLPYMTQVAVGKLPELHIFGNDYPTPDGTGIRDYLHVTDLARGHLCAIEQLTQWAGGMMVHNLGTGRGYSVLEMVNTFEQVTGQAVPYRIVARRPGDIAICYANPQRANQELGWTAQMNLDTMIADSWRWQVNNPHGY